MYKKLRQKDYVWLVAIAALLMSLPFIGFADFSTKGEPREAIVAVNMLKSGNWVLPIDSAGDMAYKPPLFHWMIAIGSSITGHVTEFWSRLPSAIAFIILCISTYAFFSCKNKNSQYSGLMTTMLLMTSFEIYRASTNCRVDMLLTMCIVLSIMSLFHTVQKSRKYKLLWYLCAILCMSGATLTKGPVGIILPIGIFWIYRLLRGKGLLNTTFLAFILTTLSCVLPFLWYYAAAQQGGDKFISLALEENFGRFVGTMSYDSHVKPLWYNFVTLWLGWLPWSLFMIVISVYLFAKKIITINTLKYKFNNLHKRIRHIDAIKLYSLIAIGVILVFYSLPKSKRSVYLLPMYPFMAYWIYLFFHKLVNKGIITTRFFKRSIITIYILFIVGYGIAFPLIVNSKSDRHKSETISSYLSNGEKLYSYIPSRFMRYYLIGFYLDKDIYPLVPSMQVINEDNNFDYTKITPDILITPPENKFNVILSPEDLSDVHGVFRQWINMHNYAYTTLYESETRTGDVRKKVVLINVWKK